jgi:hypothetical protein
MPPSGVLLMIKSRLCVQSYNDRKNDCGGTGCAVRNPPTAPVALVCCAAAVLRKCEKIGSSSSLAAHLTCSCVIA